MGYTYLVYIHIILQYIMLTPDFKLSQSAEHITVILRLPYVKISSCQFYIQQYSFKFYLKPYLLSLSFEQPLKQVEQPAKATYYHDKHLLQVTLDKQNSGEHFENLNLLANLMNKNNNKKSKENSKNSKSTKRTLVEVVGEQADIKQSKTQNQNQYQNQIKNEYYYGFCHNYTKVFTNLQQQCYEIFSFNPQQVAISDRFELSQKIAQSMFDQDAYLFDKYDNEQEINQVMISKQAAKTITEMMSKFSSKQPQSYQQIRNKFKIPNKQLLVKGDQGRSIVKQILSIAFSYVYELQCMQGELSVQSAKTINNTSAVLSCCVDYELQDYKTMLEDCARRCIIYSLYKSVQICNKVIKSLSTMFKYQFVCAMLSNLKAIFDKSEPRYLLNTIYIDDYLIYCLKGKIQLLLQQAITHIKQIQIAEEQLNLSVQEDVDEQNQSQDYGPQKIQDKKQQRPIQQLQQNNSFKKKGVLIEEIETLNQQTLQQNQNPK